MRATCYRCFWPQPLCWCGSIIPMETRTRFVFLTHPKEFKQEKAGTGRLTHLCLANSEVHMGVGFDDQKRGEGDPDDSRRRVQGRQDHDAGHQDRIGPRGQHQDLQQADVTGLYV